ERRQADRLALGDQGAREAVVIVPNQRAIDRVIREVGRHDHLALVRSTSSASGDLLEQREQRFGGVKLRAVERVVGAEHAKQGQAGEVGPFAQFCVSRSSWASPPAIASRMASKDPLRRLLSRSTRTTRAAG